MNEREEDRILALLYEEAPESESASLSESASEELDAFRDVLARVRSLPDEEPSPHLDSLILAEARMVAEKAELANQPWWRRWLSGPGLGLALAATATVFVAVLVVPEMRDSEPALQSIPETLREPKALEDQAVAKMAPPPPVVAEAPAGARFEAAPTEEAEAVPEPDRVLGLRRSRAPAKPSPRTQVAAEDEGGAPLAKAASGKSQAGPRADEKVPAKKGDFADGRGAGSLGTLSGASGGGAAGLADGDEERSYREGAAELDDLVSRAKRKEESKKESAASADVAQNEAPSRATTAAPAAPTPAPAQTAESKRIARPATEPTARPADKPAQIAEAERDGEAKDNAPAILTIRARAQTLERAGDVDGARKYLLGTRRGAVGTPMYEEVSYELAELELRQKRFGPAEAYARDVLTTKDPLLASRARALIRRIQEASR